MNNRKITIMSNEIGYTMGNPATQGVSSGFLATESPEAAEESLKKSATGKHIISAYEKKKHSMDKA